MFFLFYLTLISVTDGCLQFAFIPKVFRMGNFIDLLHKTVNALSVKGTALRLLSVIAQSMKAVWLFLDHIIWFGKVGLVKVSLY